MTSSFKLASNVSLAYSPLAVVLPFDAPTGEAWDTLVRNVNRPLTLATPTKQSIDVDVMAELVPSLVLNAEGDRPVITAQFSEDGWDRLAYLFLTSMANQVKKNPKSVPRSYRTYANLMDKLTERPTGNGKIDGSRKVVIDRAIEQLTIGVREEIKKRILAVG